MPGRRNIAKAKKNKSKNNRNARNSTTNTRQPPNIPLPETPSPTRQASPGPSSHPSTGLLSPLSPTVPRTPADVIQHLFTIVDKEERTTAAARNNTNLPIYLPRDLSFYQLLDPTDAVLKKMWDASIELFLCAPVEKYQRNLLGHARRLDPHWPHVKPRADEHKDAKLARAITAHALRYAYHDVLTEWIFDSATFPSIRAPPPGESGRDYGLVKAVTQARRVMQIAKRFEQANQAKCAIGGYLFALKALIPYSPADASMMTYYQAVFTGLPQVEYDIFVGLHRCCTSLPADQERPDIITNGGITQYFEIFPESAFLTLAQRRHCLELNIEFILVYRELFTLVDLSRAVKARSLMSLPH